MIKFIAFLKLLNRPIQDNLLFFTFMLLTGMFCIITEPGFGMRLIALFNLFFDLYILCAVLSFLPIKLRKILRMILYVTLYVIAFVDITCYERIGISITPVFIQLVEQSNFHESYEALTSYLSPSLIFSRVGILLLIVIANIALSKTNRLPIRFSTLSGTVTGIAFIVCGIISSEDIEYKYYRLFLGLSELKTQERKDINGRAGWYLPIYRLAYSISENNRLKSTISGLNNAVGRASVKHCNHTSPNIVLIIGESFNRHHSELYGYFLPTTPYQCKREKNGELIKYSQVISSWNVTCESFENMLSTWSEGEKGNWYDYPLFPEFFRKAGYKVSFFSNQFVTDPAQGFSDFIEDIFINNEHISKVNFDIRNKNVHKYDEELINDYEQQKDTARYKFTIFHFLNMHADFKQRYPQCFDKFKPSDYTFRHDLSAGDKQVLAEYDNAVRYCDYVINKIINIFQKTETIIVFLPDHGERVFDNSTEWGRSLSWDKNSLIQQFSIPMWIWASDAYKARHPAIWKAIGKSKDCKYMTDNLPQLMFHLAGIETKYYKAENDILSQKYKENRKRIIRHERDYDTIVKQH